MVSRNRIARGSVLAVLLSLLYNSGADADLESDHSGAGYPDNETFRAVCEAAEQSWKEFCAQQPG